jgi:predicted dehydrogenase
VGRNHVKEMRDLEVISKEGMIFVDLFSNKILEASSGTYSDGSFVQELPYSKRDHLLLEHQAFYHSIQNKKEAIIGLKDGMNAVHLIDCALKAMENHSAVDVKFPRV